MRGADQQILQDTDMAGPLVFCLALGGFLLLVTYEKYLFIVESLKLSKFNFFLEWQSDIFLYIRYWCYG